MRGQFEQTSHNGQMTWDELEELALANLAVDDAISEIKHEMRQITLAALHNTAANTPVAERVRNTVISASDATAANNNGTATQEDSSSASHTQDASSHSPPAQILAQTQALG